MGNIENRRIMVVEDDRATAALTERILEKHGYSVITLNTGEEAVIEAEKYPEPVCILMDIDLGDGIDGCEAARRIMENREVPIVFFSSLDGPLLLEKTKGVAASGFIAKGAGEHVLITSINLALNCFDEKKEKDKLLLLREHRYRRMFENMQDVFYQTDMSGIIVEISPSVENFSGFLREEVIGMPVKSFYGNPKERNVLLDLLREKHEVKDFEVRLKTKDNRNLYVSVTSHIIYGQQGKPVGVEGILRDITDLKEMTEARKKSDELLKGMLNVVPDLISIHDREMNILYSNWQGLGKIPKENRVLNTKCHKTYRGFDEICPDCRAKEVLETCMAVREEVELPDGTWSDLRVIPLVNENNKVEMFMEWVRDITDRKHLEENYRIIAENTTDVIWTADMKFRTTYISPSVEKLMGDTPEEHMARSVEDKYYPEDLAHFAKLLSEELEKEKEPGADKNRSRLIETRIKRKDGGFVWVEYNVRFLRNASGEVIGILGVNRDISKRKEQEQKLIKALEESVALKEKADRLLREKELVLKEAHHRIKNNMNAIQGLLLLQAEEAGNENQADVLKAAAGRVHAMMRLYDRLYRSENLNDLNIRDFLVPLIKEIIDILKSPADIATDIKVEDFHLNSSILSTVGIIINELITNSVKHAFKEKKKGRISLNVFNKSDKVTVIYCDNGPGITNDNTKATFGMDLIEMLVQQIEGKLIIENDNGACFTVTFPA